MAPTHHVWLLIVLHLLRTALSAPSCQNKDRSDLCTAKCNSYKFYTCVNIFKVGDFYHFARSALHYENVWFTVKDGELDYYPAGVFMDYNVSALEFNGAKVKSYAQFGSGPNPFWGLENSLEIIVFKDSTLPDTWSMLNRLNMLEKLEFHNYNYLALTRDFNGLPQSVNRVYIYKSRIGYVEDDWLSELKNLRLVIIQDSHLKKFTRAMLPRPAPMLKELDLERNLLTSLPKDIGEDMPVLEFLNIGRNNLTTIEEDSVRPLRNSTYVYMYGNPLRCDCSLRFLLSYPDSWTYALCQTPEKHKDRYLQTLSSDDLAC
ncbi:protein slit-like [Ornithodoros turicata]|uniref:protein slit-like n=1 Tax=Ornithodoros turicata TaxID=34597 RepID=UPI003139CE26